MPAIGEMRPAQGWIGALWAQGVGLIIVELGYRTSHGPAQAAWARPALLFGLGLAGLALLFAAAVPDSSEQENLLSPLALRLLRLAPAPRLAARVAAVAACAVPFLVYWPGDALTFSTLGLVAALAAGTLARGGDTDDDPGWWDVAAPFLMTALVMLYGLTAESLPPARPGFALAGLVLTAFAQSLLLRRAAARHWAAAATISQKERGVPDVTIPLEAYSAETENLAPAEPAPVATASGGPTLVDSGGFRIDTRKMIEKLRERQLADAEDFVLAWLRCAVASGARGIWLDRDWESLLIQFDGRPFSREQLSDPYRALLDPEAQEATRGSQFAYGLLAILRLKPRSICVYSGAGRERALTRLATRGAADAPVPRDSGSGTLIAASFGLPGLWWAFRAARRAQRRVGLSEAGVTVNGRPVRSFPEEEGWKAEESGGWRLQWRPRPGEVASRIRFFHLGALVEELEEPLRLPAQVDVALSHADLVLSISQSSVVRNELFQDGLALAARGR